MDCQHVLERLYEFLDRELSEADVVTVRGHLASCPHCTDRFYFEERFLGRVRRLRDIGERAPAELRDAIILRLKRD